jgi:HlyD family secretion protein
MQNSLLKKGAIAIAALLTLGAIGWVVTTQGPLAAVKVTVTRVAHGTLSSQVFGIGTIEARRRYALGPTAPGRLAEILVDEGERVARGAVLARMDTVDLEERLQGAALAISKAAHGVRAAEAQLTEARSRATLATATLQRYREMRAQNFISLEALEAKGHEARAAEAAREAAAQGVLGARADLARSEAERDALRQQQAQLTLLSPVDGVVIARRVEPGSTVVAGQAVVELIDPTSLRASARIDQRQAGLLRPGQAATIVLRSQPGVSHPGEVERIERLSDSVTEERTVLLTFTPPPQGLSPGELVEVTVQQQTLDAVAWLPTAAIHQHNGENGVWVPGDAGLAFYPLTVGITTLDGKSELLSPLDPELEVVLHSQQLLSAGTRISVVDSLVDATR